MKNDLNQTINDNVYQWFVAQRSKKIRIHASLLNSMLEMLLLN